MFYPIFFTTLKSIKFTYFLYFFCASLLIYGCQADIKSEEPKNDTISKGARQEFDNQAVKNILFFGNSLTAGLGVESSEAFPALIQKKIDSLNLPYKVINAGLSGETSAAGKNRIEWLLKQKIDVFVLELGANDGLRGIPVAETESNLQAILDKVKAKFSEVKLVLLGMEVPPNMGSQYTSGFRVIFKNLAEKNKIAFVPFLLEGVGGVTELNQGDGIHPTAEGHQILAENVWKVLEKEL